MKDIQECAKFYGELLNKDYIFTLENSIKFKLIFAPSNFFHLLGLEKLKDVSMKQPAKMVYFDILSGRISPEIISNSSFYRVIEQRIKQFEELGNMLNSDKSKIIVDFNKNIVPFTELKNTKYILYRHKNEGYAHFTMGSKGKGVYPETFFFEESKRYVTGQILLDIVKIETVIRK